MTKLMQLRFPCILVLVSMETDVFYNKGRMSILKICTRESVIHMEILKFFKKLIMCSKNYTDKKVYVWYRLFSYLCEMSVKWHSYVQEYELNGNVN